MSVWMKWAIALALGFGFIVLGWRLSNSWLSFLLPTFFVVNCLFLIIVVLLQSGKAKTTSEPATLAEYRR